ncbi:MAG: 23S rRNA (adenine(2503)-C(2))-methyltransferase RlmN [bacterium]
MVIDNLGEVLKNEPSYRLQQAKKAVFKDLLESWGEATSLPLVLRQKLEKDCPLSINGKTFVSQDKQTIKSLITLKDGLAVESVLMRNKDGRNTVCISSQIGCPLGCSFCATGKMGFKRNLEVQEIIEQVLFFARILQREKQKITNIVFMGMGEPFLNYDNVLAAIRALNNKDGLNLGARHFSISTVGIIEGIEKMAGENLEVNLAISLHSPDEKMRQELMPISKKYSIVNIIGAVDDYIKRTHRRVMFEYIMINGVNDSDYCGEKLAKLMKKPLYFVNLIVYNPTGVFNPSSLERIARFRKILESKGVAVTQRYRFGDDVAAACGQLASVNLPKK